MDNKFLRKDCNLIGERRWKIVILNAPTPTKNSPYIYYLKYINLEYNGVDYRALFPHFLKILRSFLHVLYFNKTSNFMLCSLPTVNVYSFYNAHKTTYT